VYITGTIGRMQLNIRCSISTNSFRLN